MDSKRVKKVAQLIQEELSEFFRKQASNSPLKGILITVTHVKVTTDLSISTVYLSIFPKENRTKILNEINENNNLYRKYIGNSLGKVLRIIPNIKFFLDTSMDYVENIERELKGEGNNPII